MTSRRARNSLGKLIGFGFTLIMALIILWALSLAFNPLFASLPQPSGSLVSTASSYSDATDVAALVLNMLAVVGGGALSKDHRVMGIITLILFAVFLGTGL
jgi:hypothetical protein